MEDRSYRRMRTLVTPTARSGLSANQIAGALISMMARSTTQLQSEAGYIDARPHLPRSTKTSCTARPDHTCGVRIDKTHSEQNESALPPKAAQKRTC
jgi:hypothetical protein